MTPPRPESRTIRLFEFELNAEPLQATARRCIALAREARGGAAAGPALVFSLNPEKVVKSGQDPIIGDLLRKATILNPDGIGICLAARLLAGQRLERVAGSDLMPLLCGLAEQAGLSVYVFGASASSNAAALRNMRRLWPGLRIVGASDGFRLSGAAADGSDAVERRIAALRPDIVFVGLGSPLQEAWMADVGVTLPVGLLQGVGGTIDVLGGSVRRAPLAWRRLGLEWLYRLLADPRRWRRQLTLVAFVALVLRSYGGQLLLGRNGLESPLADQGVRHRRGRT